MSTALATTDARWIDLGTVVWSSTRGYEGVDDDGSQLEPVGGVVVEVLDTVDEATGELGRAFRCLDPYRARPRLTWHVLAESEVDRTTLDVAAPSTIGNLYRRLCEEVAMNGHKRRSGLVMPEHVALAPHIHRLGSLLA